MKNGDAHSNGGSFYPAWLNPFTGKKWVVLNVVHRLRNAPINQAGPQPRAEQHADPRERRKIRFVVVLPQLHIAKPTDEKPKNEKQRQGHHQHVEPVKCADDEVFAFGKYRTGVFDVLNCEGDECQDHDH